MSSNLKNTLSSNGSFGVLFFKSLLELSGKLVVTLLTARLQIDVIELRLLVEFSVTKRTGEVVHTPGLVQGSKYVASYYLIAHKAEITE